MRLYRLDIGEYDFDYDRIRSIVVWAVDEPDARQLAALAEDTWTLDGRDGQPPAATDPTKAPWWLDPARSTCTEVAPERGIVQAYVRHG